MSVMPDSSLLCYLFRMFTSLRLASGSLLFLALIIAQASREKEKEDFEFTRRQIHTAPNFVPKAGMDSDESTATAIAYAVAVLIYGKKVMDEELPFRADLKGGIWTVLGTLHCSSCAGGTVVIQIDKATGQIVYLTHFQ